MISSHETQEDFFQFYSGLIELADKLNVYFELQYIMQDSCQPYLNAAVRLFYSEILMCYFHVIHNIRKNLKKMVGGNSLFN